MRFTIIEHEDHKNMTCYEYERLIEMSDDYEYTGAINHKGHAIDEMKDDCIGCAQLLLAVSIREYIDTVRTI